MQPITLTITEARNRNTQSDAIEVGHHAILDLGSGQLLWAGQPAEAAAAADRMAEEFDPDLAIVEIVED